MPHKDQPDCHCAVCNDGYSRIDSTSTSLARGASRPSLVAPGRGSSAMTLRSECLSTATRGSPTTSPTRKAGSQGSPPFRSGGGGSGSVTGGSTHGFDVAGGRTSPGGAAGRPGTAGPGAPRTGAAGPGGPGDAAGTPRGPSGGPRGAGGPGGPGGPDGPGGGAGGPPPSYATGRGAGREGRPRPTGAGIARRSALADKYMYSDVDMVTEEPDVPGGELDYPDEPCVDLERDDSDLHKVDGRVEPWLPQPGDDASPAGPAAPREGDEAPTMEPVGPWAQGRPDWGPLAGLTGTRPVVDRHSITRYSAAEWRKRNLDTVQRAAGDNHNAGMVEYNGRACMQHVSAEADKNQLDCTSRLQQRAMDVHRWLDEVHKAHGAIWAEIQQLETFRARLRRLLGTLTKCASVAGQCLEVRTRRCEPDLVRDQPEEELIKEVALVQEVRGLMQRCLQQVEEQQRSSRATKARLSSNWSDKKLAYETDTYSSGLRSADPTALFHEGATRFPDGQSTPEGWEAASREDVCLAENERAKSAMLRNLIDAMVHDAARDLRAQEARVDEAVQRRVQVVTGLLQDLEGQLALINRRIMETEQLIEELKRALRQLDMALKVAQTRLKVRMDRNRVEHTRDGPQYGLVDEVKSISEQCSALLGQLKQAEDALQSLQDTRHHLEKDIVHKRKCLHLDRDRIQVIRQHYPPAAALTGLH